MNKLLQTEGKRLSSSPYERYIIASAENNVPYKMIATRLAEELYKHGKLDSPEPVSVTSHEAGPLLQVFVVSTSISHLLDAYVGLRLLKYRITAQNALINPKRVHELGWTPTGPTLAETFADDVMIALEDA